MTEQPSEHHPQPSAQGNSNLLAVLSHAFVFTGFLFPLIFWLVGKDQSSFVDAEGKKALNFGILVTLGYVAANVLGVIPLIGWLGAILTAAVFVVAVILGIQGAVTANKGVGYRYPFTIDLIK
ncbi:DUF4870 domain-containing protein [Demequina sp. NBRC 110057]|uniref:DUF4870 domain-containing protein n=1 Tax=Demequina sp. NBRC 110057 TaxID=1570346 RepID=UPI0009FE404D|nr:DUF4870 domain-containing protein [Demequina sp. NBRC 110057]